MALLSRITALAYWAAVAFTVVASFASLAGSESETSSAESRLLLWLTLAGLILATVVLVGVFRSRVGAIHLAAWAGGFALAVAGYLATVESPPGDRVGIAPPVVVLALAGQAAGVVAIALVVAVASRRRQSV